MQNIIEQKLDIEAVFVKQTITERKDWIMKNMAEKNWMFGYLPVIPLYGVMSNIDEHSNLNKSGLYNRIFTEKGSVL